ncbi:MAG TPA: metallophosphoesterase [bacterium]|nr:metallophosphoesterase [bacterium]
MSETSICRVEVVTVSEYGARVHWRANGSNGFEAACFSRHDKTSHAAKIEVAGGRYYLGVFEGLDCDSVYDFQISRAGAVIYKSSFRTLKRPRGDFNFRFATINDIHIGEEIYGLIFLPGMKWPPLTPGLKLDIDGAPFWQYSNEAVIEELNALELDFVIVKGDLITDHTEKNIITAKEMLDKLKHPYYILRGNHDRAGGLPEDYFMKHFELDERWCSFEHKGYGFLLLDNINPKNGNTAFSKRQIDWFESEMIRMKDLPVFVYMHNPPMRMIERSFVNRVDEFLSIIDAHPMVEGVFYGHSHGNKRMLRKAKGKSVPFVETAATMDYPGGYNVYDVYSGGYVQMCIRPHDERSCKWRELNEKAYYGLAMNSLFGKIDDRNFTWEHKTD